jgi:dihydrodipicolinate synthase/N-acetylneuraminate lyase
MSQRSDLESVFSRLSARRVHAISAVLLPYTPAGAIDWDAFERHLRRTRAAGLDVAVNMDTGFGDLLSDRERLAVLDATQRLCNGELFFAGAFADASGDYRVATRVVRING